MSHVLLNNLERSCCSTRDIRPSIKDICLLKHIFYKIDNTVQTVPTQLRGTNERGECQNVRSSGNLWHVLEANSGPALSSLPHHMNSLHTFLHHHPHHHQWADSKGQEIGLRSVHRLLGPPPCQPFPGNVLCSPKVSTAQPDWKM